MYHKTEETTVERYHSRETKSRYNRVQWDLTPSIVYYYDYTRYICCTFISHKLNPLGKTCRINYNQQWSYNGLAIEYDLSIVQRWLVESEVDRMSYKLILTDNHDVIEGGRKISQLLVY